MDEPTSYRFRWSNVDLARYIESRMAKATLLRREAQTLVTRADAIEEEARSLEIDLVEVERFAADT